MLVRFATANFRSFDRTAELSMVAADDRAGTFPMDTAPERIVPVAAVYGANGSGKTNVLRALAWLVDAVRDSLKAWTDDVPVDPFAFTTDDAPSSFEVELTTADGHYLYEVRVNPQEILHERLFRYVGGDYRPVFTRHETHLDVTDDGEWDGVRQLLGPTVLVASAALRLGRTRVSDFARGLSSVQHQLDRSALGPSEIGHLFEGGFGQLTPVARRLMQVADLGLDDAVLTVSPDPEDTTHSRGPSTSSETPRWRPTGRRLTFLHTGNGTTFPLPMSAESEGTLTWFSLLGPVLKALHEGGVLLLDELGANLHPTLTAALLDLFRDPESNPDHAQLLFTTHDSSLLKHLHADEVWLTEKHADGATRLSALADFDSERVRTSHGLEEGYLEGRFGAVPQLDPSGLRRGLRGLSA